MRIDRIELWHVALPLPAPFRPSWIPGMTQHECRFDLIRLFSGGLSGVSAAPAMGRERAGLGDLLGPYFLGERADDLASVRQRIREMGYLGFRVGFIEAACWDLLGRARRKPVWQLLAEAEGVTVPSSPVRLYASTGTVHGERAGEVVAARLSEGFEAVKLRVHEMDPAADAAVIRAGRAAAPGAPLMVDANQGWRVAVVADAPRWDAARALDFCRLAGELRYDWVEEPLPFDDYEGLATLRKALAGAVPIAGGELNNQGLPEFRVMLEKGCYDIYQPDACFTGGISGTWAILRAVRAAGAAYSPHTWTNGIGFAMNLHLFIASGQHDRLRLEYPLEPPGWVPSAWAGLQADVPTHQNGTLSLPTAAGLGVEIEPAVLGRYGSCAVVASPLRVAAQAVWQRGVRAARELGAVREARLKARSEELDRRFAAGEDAVRVGLAP